MNIPSGDMLMRSLCFDLACFTTVLVSGQCSGLVTGPVVMVAGLHGYSLAGSSHVIIPGPSVSVKIMD